MKTMYLIEHYAINRKNGVWSVSRTVKNALTALKMARQWLQTQHSFCGEDGDPIKCTGWQFVGYNIIAAVVAILLCIEY